MELLLQTDVIGTKKSKFFIHIGLDPNNSFQPVLQIFNLGKEGCSKKRQMELSLSQWFSFTRKYRKHIYDLLCLASGRGGYDYPDSRPDLREALLPSVHLNMVINIGKYSLKLDQSTNTIGIFDQDDVIIHFDTAAYTELITYYEVISLKLELLLKYQLYTKYLFSRIVNYFLQNSSTEGNVDTLYQIKIEHLPELENVHILCANLDTIICQQIFAELKVFAKSKIIDTIKAIKTTFSDSFHHRNHFYD